MSQTHRPHWTEHYTFENRQTKERLTAAALRQRYERFLRLSRFNLINCTLRDTVRMDDASQWDRVQ